MKQLQSYWLGLQSIAETEVPLKSISKIQLELAVLLAISELNFSCTKPVAHVNIFPFIYVLFCGMIYTQIESRVLSSSDSLYLNHPSSHRWKESEFSHYTSLFVACLLIFSMVMDNYCIILKVQM